METAVSIFRNATQHGMVTSKQNMDQLLIFRADTSLIPQLCLPQLSEANEYPIPLAEIYIHLLYLSTSYRGRRRQARHACYDPEPCLERAVTTSLILTLTKLHSTSFPSLPYGSQPMTPALLRFPLRLVFKDHSHIPQLFLQKAAHVQVDHELEIFVCAL